MKKFFILALITICSVVPLSGYSSQKLADANDNDLLVYNDTSTNSMRYMNMWMFSFMPMYMNMNKTFKGDSRYNIPQKKDTKTGSGYMMGPEGAMQMQMYMFMGMYMTHDWSFMVMGSYNITSMPMFMSMKHRHTSQEMYSKGFGDTQLIGGIYQINNSHHRLEWQFGISLPTGRINYASTMSQMGPTVYGWGYAMQQGSGTFDPIAGIKYTYYQTGYTTGAEFMTTQRLYENYKHYRLGSIYTLSGNYNYNITKDFSLGTKLIATYTAPASGKSLASSEYFGVGYLTNDTGGFIMSNELNMKYSVNNSNKFELAVSLPLYQYYRGVQMGTSFIVSGKYTYMI